MPRTKRASASRSSGKKKPRLKSKFEQRFYDELQKRGLDFAYEPDSFEYTLVLRYKPDWKVRDGLYIETKGKFDYTERRKILAVREANPDAEFRMVFMRDQKLGKGSKMTYGQWCDKHGIKWSVFPKLPITNEDLKDE